MSNFSEQTWRDRAAAKLAQFKQWLTGGEAPYLAYGTVAALSLWPAVEAAAQAPPGQLPITIYLALGSLAGSVGANLLAEQLQRWRDQATPVTEPEVIAWIQANVAAHADLLTALDALIAKLDGVTAVHSHLSPTDQTWLTQTLRHELARLGNEARYTANLSAPGAIAQGHNNTAVASQAVNAPESIINAPIITGTWIGNFIPPDPAATADTAALRTTYLGRLLEQTSLLPLSALDRASIDTEDTPSTPSSRLPLKTVYTALLTTDSTGDLPGLLGRGGRGKGQAISALQQLDRHQHLVLLGDPGSGKSTFANFVAACLAGANLGHPDLNLELLIRPLPDGEGADQAEPQPWSHGPLLPLLVILRDLAAEGLPDPATPATADHLWQFLAHHSHTPAFVPHLQRDFARRGGLLILDGLDEVPEADLRRQQIQDLVADLKATLPHVRLLVTSRVYAYQQQAWALSGFTAVMLAPFSWGQICRFIDRWYIYTATLRGGTESKARQDAALLRQTIADRRELRDLAERPLLLTLMTSLHAWRGGTLPGRRAQLYDETVELLLDKWENLRLVKDPTTGRLLHKSLAEVLKVGKDALRRLLEKLAYEAHAAQPDPDSEQAVDIAENDLITALCQLSRREDLQPRLLTIYLRDRAGLLIDRGGGVYTFPHRTFQEFLAACYAADRHRSEMMTTAARTDPSRWREVLLLAVAHASKGYTGAVWDFVPCLCPEEADTTPTGHLTTAELWGTHLAGLALVEVETNPANVGQRDKAALRRVRQRLQLALADARLPAPERAKAAVSLAQLGDTRPEVLQVDALRFCYVPPGHFMMGTDEPFPAEDDPDIQQIRQSERPAHPVDIPYGYWMGQYPITNAQFQLFVNDGGYAQAAYWPEAIAAGFWQEGQVRGWTWIPEKKEGEWLTRNRPYDYGRPFNLPNHPVVGVNWYEALAFTRWLTHCFQARGWLPGPESAVAWRICLPSEAEWEKAARGGRQLPDQALVGSLDALSTLTPPLALGQPGGAEPTWGAEQANGAASKIRATNGVGCFPASRSPYGCQEMVGNVWEWTRSLYGRYDSAQSLAGKLVFDPFYTYPYQPSTDRERLDRDDYWPRVLRGGSWDMDETWLRCAVRYGNGPNLRNDDVGCRVLASPFTAGL